MFDYPIYKQLEHFIVCKNKDEIFPRRWDELEIDFNNKNKKVCPISKKEITLVSNVHNYNEAKEIQEYLALPINSPLFSELLSEYEEEFNLYVFIQATRVLIQGAGYSENIDLQYAQKSKATNWAMAFLKEEFDRYNQRWETKEEKIQRVIKDYEELGVDLKEVIEVVAIRYDEVRELQIVLKRFEG